MRHLLLRNPIPRSTDDGGAGGGGDTAAGGGGADTTGGGAGADSLGGGGAGADLPWYNTLPDDLKTQPGVIRHKSLTDAIQAGIAAEKRLGVPASQLAKLPSSPDDREAVTAIYRALGAPETADGYKIKIEGASEADQAMVADFAKHMHEKGPFPPDALAAAAEFWAAKTKAAGEAEDQELAALTAAGEAALRTEWGAAFDTKSQEVGDLIKELGGPALAKELNASTLGDHPELAKMMAKIVDLRAESGPGGDGQNADLGKRQLSPGQARSAVAELEGDPVKGVALRDNSHPQHKAVVEERQRLLLMAHPQPTA